MLKKARQRDESLEPLAGSSTDMHAWAVPGPCDIAATWRKELIGWGVDRDACMRLFNLSQRDEQSYRAAVDIIGVLIKKRCDREMIHNPSGFVHNCVLRARFGHKCWKKDRDETKYIRSWSANETKYIRSWSAK